MAVPLGVVATVTTFLSTLLKAQLKDERIHIKNHDTLDIVCQWLTKNEPQLNHCHLFVCHVSGKFRAATIKRDLFLNRNHMKKHLFFNSLIPRDNLS